MRNRSISFGLVAGCVLMASPQADACGDKFLRMGRTLRVSRAAHPASILIYMRRDSVVPAAAKDLKLSRALKQAGHRIRAVEREDELEAELKSGTYDIVVADAGSGAAIQQIRTGNAKPRFLPLLNRPTKQELAAAEKQYRCFLAAPAKTQGILAEIDHVMEERRQGTRTGL